MYYLSSKYFISRKWQWKFENFHFRTRQDERPDTTYKRQKTMKKGNIVHYSKICWLESDQPCFLEIIPVLKKRSQLFLAGVRAASGAGVLLANATAGVWFWSNWRCLRTLGLRLDFDLELDFCFCDGAWNLLERLTIWQIVSFVCWNRSIESLLIARNNLFTSNNPNLSLFSFI